MSKRKNNIRKACYQIESFLEFQLDNTWALNHVKKLLNKIIRTTWRGDEKKAPKFNYIVEDRRIVRKNKARK